MIRLQKNINARFQDRQPAAMATSTFPKETTSTSTAALLSSTTVTSTGVTTSAIALLVFELTISPHFRTFNYSYLLRASILSQELSRSRFAAGIAGFLAPWHGDFCTGGSCCNCEGSNGVMDSLQPLKKYIFACL